MKKNLLILTLAFLGFTIGTNAQTIWSQNFSTAVVPAMPTGWTNTHTGAGQGWVTSNTNVDLYFSTAVAAAPDAVFAVVNDYAVPGNAPAYMNTPTFSLSGMTNAYLTYDYVFNKAYTSAAPYTGELAWVDISTNGGTTWTTIDSVPYVPTSAWYSRAISLSAYSTFSTVLLRWGYTDGGASLLGCAIGNIKVFNAQANDISITAVTPAAGDPSAGYIVTGGSANFGGVMQNLSPNTISSFTATYKVGASAAVPSTFTGLSVAPMGSYTFACTTPYSVASLGQQNVVMWVTETGDPVLTNDTLGTSITGVSSFPAKRVMVEEATGTWCGYCVRGTLFMDSLWKNYPNGVSIVSVHDRNGYDPMANENASTTAYDTWISSKIPGYPDCVYDRTYFDDPSSWSTYIPTMNNWFAFADMRLTATISGTTLTANATITPALNLTGSYQLEYVVTEDDVYHNTGGTTGGWSQHNYYSNTYPGGGVSGVGALVGCGYNFNDSVDGGASGSVPMYMHYHFVDRMTAPASVSASPNGIAGSLPGTMTSGTAYNHTQTFTIASDWSAPHLRVICMLIDNNPTSNTYGHVLNSQIAYSPTLGTSNVTAGIEGFNVSPNPTNGLTNISFGLKENSKVQLTVYDALGRVANSYPSETMEAGNQRITISTSSLAAGIYNVVLTTDNGMMTERLSVIK